MIDIVYKVEKLSLEVCKKESEEKLTATQKPMYKDPSDIPNFDTIEEITIVESHEERTVDNEPSDISIVSTDEFVPDVLETGSKLPNSIPLNWYFLTSQLS